MFAIALTKTTITAGGVAATLLITGGSLGVYKTSATSQTNSARQASIKQIDENGQNTITPIATLRHYSFAIIEEGARQIKKSPEADYLEARCKLEGGTIEELCSVSPKEVGDEKKWIDLVGLEKIGFVSLIPKGHITEAINVYRVRVSPAFIAEWTTNQEKKLNIFNYADNIDTAKPLITLEPKLAIMTNGNYVGKMQYVVGNVRTFEEKEGTSQELETAGKSFTCALPTGNSEEYKGCELYHFGENNDALSSFSKHQLRTPLTKLTKVKKLFHHLIKFDEPMTIHPRKYEIGETLKIKVYIDSKRSVEATTGIASINLKYLSPTIIFDKDNKADLALVL